MAERLNNVISSFQNMESGRERFRQSGIGEGQDDRYRSWETYIRQERQTSQATVTGQVELMGDINIKVDAPTTLTDQQIFSIFNNPEVKDNIYRIVKARTDAAIKEFKNN
jgi:hypothetical protein